MQETKDHIKFDDTLYGRNGAVVYKPQPGMFLGEDYFTIVQL